MLILWKLMSGQRAIYIAALVAMALSITVGYAVPLVSQVTIDAAISGRALESGSTAEQLLQWFGGAEWLRTHLWVSAAALVSLTLLSGLLQYFKGRWSCLASEAIVQRLRNRLHDHLQHLPSSYHDNATIGDLIQRCTSDVESVRSFLSSQILEISSSFLMLATVIPLMFWLNWKMMLVSLSLIPLIVFFGFFFFKKIRHIFKQTDEADGAMTAVLQESLSGIRVVKAFARQDYELEKFSETSAALRDHSFRRVQLMAWYWSISDLLCFLQNGLILSVGIYWVAQDTLTIGTLFAFLAYVNMFLWPVRQMGRILAQTGKTQVALQRLSEILDQPREADSVKSATTSACGTGGLSTSAPDNGNEIVFEKVTFGYRPDQPILNGFSLSVKSGEILAIVGPAGSGKSTLIHLLLRLYDYSQGSIRLKGQEIKELSRKDVRSQMASVLQEPFLFSRNLKENILLGHSAASDAEIHSAAESACIHESIKSFDKGYETMVGEKGVMLSGGQRQRVAIARALVSRPALLLLDDSLSAVDTRTEALILETLRQRRGKSTTLVVTHRLSTLAAADRIAVIEKGQVSELGSHAELLKNNGLYARLWKIQTSLEADLEHELRPSASSPIEKERVL